MNTGPYRSLLFAPGNHERRVEKVFGAGVAIAEIQLQKADPPAEVIDKGQGGTGVVPYLPLPELQKRQGGAGR